MKLNSSVSVNLAATAFCNDNGDGGGGGGMISLHTASQMASLTSDRKPLPVALFSRTVILCFSWSWEETNSLCRRATWVCKDWT